MDRVSSIAFNTFREGLRQRVVYMAVALVLCLVPAAMFVSPLALGEGPRIVRDLGLSVLSLSGVFVIVMVGTSLLHKEVERRSIYVLLSKPVTRAEYLMGKYLGLMLLLAVTLAPMLLGVLGMDFWMTGRWHPVILVCGAGTLVELAVLTAWAMLFSAVATPFLAGIFILGCYVIGNAVVDLRDLANYLRVGGQVVTWLSYLAPNLYLFNFRAQVAEGIMPGGDQLGFALLYGALYTTVVLMTANALFRRREFA